MLQNNTIPLYMNFLELFLRTQSETFTKQNLNKDKNQIGLTHETLSTYAPRQPRLAIILDFQSKDAIKRAFCSADNVYVSR